MPFTIGACTRIPHDLGQKAVVVVCILSAFSEVLAVYLTKTFFIVEGSVKRFIIDLLFRLKSGWIHMGFHHFTEIGRIFQNYSGTPKRGLKE